jgi:protoporphyrinogen oxidase
VFQISVVERQPTVGGNAGSFELAGMPVDFGRHRLHNSCAPEILADIRHLLGADLLDRPRHGRIRLSGRWVHFPLKAQDLALHLPLSFSWGVASDIAAKPFSSPAKDTFAAVLERGLGKTICRDFYFPYARKIWGVPPDELDPEQARRRVSAGSLWKMVRKVLNAIPGLRSPGAGRFFYPRNGFGAISHAYYCAARKAGADIVFGTSVTRVEVENRRATGVWVKDTEEPRFLPAQQTFSTIPVTALVRAIDPPAPPEVLDSATALRFRSMILIYLVLETERFTDYDAHYFPGTEIAITRLSEPKNYGLRELPGQTVICAELPCSVQDPVWRASDEDLKYLVCEALAKAGLPVRARVLEVATRRLPQAYPIYSRDYRRHFDRIDSWLGEIDGLITFGRQGLFAHDNTHHALAMAYALSDCVNATGTFDRGRWAARRLEFQHHVVED